nr:immunoglobulin heavy chain junction region [Macaca mulatta]MOV37960.1 immunoglobulin heavy chain junction region [Macaca mulatta]MOV37982.1 immunoglobulin heavy chain junction region [Macaca mulatta]MOV38051.1 immunoglobulin heavy chain junction region [Macaca mulatta]MOV38663.1 immunoglobulin heavy chain junction region [Macaca mulatta]
CATGTYEDDDGYYYTALAYW